MVARRCCAAAIVLVVQVAARAEERFVCPEGDAGAVDAVRFEDAFLGFVPCCFWWALAR